MPKIKAPTIAIHVARQEAAILDAAGELFAEQGMAGTDLSDIASAVGLARSSLYRYFPDKDHILLAWFDRELPPLIDVGASALATAPTPSEGIRAWMSEMIDVAAGSGDALLPRLLGEIAGTTPEVRPKIDDCVANLLQQLDAPVSEALGSTETNGRSTVLVGELLRCAFVAGAKSIPQGVDAEAVKTELDRLTAALVPVASIPG